MSFTDNQYITETDLIKGCIAGDRRMQENLYTKFASKMFGVCLRYCKSREEAEDILQEGFIKIFKNIDTFRQEGSFEGWVRKIFVNTAIEQYRKTITNYPISENLENTLPDNSWTAFDKLSENDILKMIQQLSPGYRTVFNLYVIDGYTHKEIAKMLKIDEGTSKSQLFRAKLILQKMILNS